jgi:pyruvate-formate lyase-activating enzyme
MDSWCSPPNRRNHDGSAAAAADPVLFVGRSLITPLFGHTDGPEGMVKAGVFGKGCQHHCRGCQHHSASTGGISVVL